MPIADRAFRAVRLRGWTVTLVLALATVGIVQAGGSSNAVRSDPAVCSQSQSLSAGTSTRTIEHDGDQRSYLMHVPPGYDGVTRTPVVFLFHGFGGSPEKVMDTTGMAAMADAEDFIVVAPLARGEVTQWDFRSPGTAATSDTSFVRDLFTEVSAQGCIDPRRSFAAGFSNGSALVLALACDPSSPFTAYGAVSGPYMSPGCSDAKPASIAYFHGLLDDVVPYTGAETAIGALPPVDDTVAEWVAHDQCPALGAITTATGELRHFAWEDCADGTAISVYVLEEAGHRWPGSRVNASALMWEFFERAGS